MTEVKGVGRRKTRLLDDLRNRRRYRKLKEEADDRKIRKRHFITNIRKKYKLSFRSAWSH